jgi:cephalosporin-C deacetylase-like acetyl esterase
MVLPLLAVVLFQSPPSWASLQAAYSYNSSSPTSVTFMPASASPDGARELTFTYTGTPGDTVHAVLVEPNSGTKFPLVVLLHGLGGDKEGMTRAFGPGLIQHGIAYAAIDAPGHGQRQNAADKAAIQKITMAFISSKGDLLKSVVKSDPDESVMRFLNRAVHDGVIDERMLLDAVLSRPEIDSSHVGLVGVSMGSIMSSILGPVDHRVGDLALEVGGDPVLPLIPTLPPDMQMLSWECACSAYASHWSGPVFMLNGSKDTVIPRDATDRLYNAFPATDRSITWFDSNHFLPAQANTDAVNWIVGKLK